MSKAIVHAVPLPGQGVTACCGRPPLEMLSDRITTDPELVTCGCYAEKRASCWRQAVRGVDHVIVACSCGLHIGERGDRS